MSKGLHVILYAFAMQTGLSPWLIRDATAVLYSSWLQALLLGTIAHCWLADGQS